MVKHFPAKCIICLQHNVQTVIFDLKCVRFSELLPKCLIKVSLILTLSLVLFQAVLQC